MKLRKKLFLSCAALAACATTLATTTYAWYTSNTTVTASDLTASTTTGGDDTLLVSLTGAAGTWGSSVTLSNTTSLLPRSYGADGKGKDDAFYAISTEGYLENESTTSGVVTFDLYFKNPAKAGNIYVSDMTFTNKTAATQEKGLLSTTGLTTVSAEKVKTYSVDLLRATNVIIKTNTATANNSDDTGISWGSEAIKYKLDTEGFHDSKTYNDILDEKKADGTSAKDAGAYATATDAIAYYNAVTGKTLKLTEDGQAVATNPLLTQTIGASGDKLDLGATLTTNIYKVTFVIFLNGWDLQCFDACQGQTFELDMEFSTVATDAITVGTESAK